MFFSLFFWPLCCLSLFDLRIVIATLVSSKSYCLMVFNTISIHDSEPTWIGVINWWHPNVFHPITKLEISVILYFKGLLLSLSNMYYSLTSWLKKYYSRYVSRVNLKKKILKYSWYFVKHVLFCRNNINKNVDIWRFSGMTINRYIYSQTIANSKSRLTAHMPQLKNSYHWGIQSFIM